MTDPIYLTEVRRLDDGRRLRLTFSDDSSGELTADRARGYCPCAVCQGHGAEEVRFQPPPRPVKAAHIEPVGNYAISIAFSDGHATGIFRFDFLHRLLATHDGTPQPR